MKLSFADVIPSRLTFNSHTSHNPDYDILELVISKDAFITYSLELKTGKELLEYYSGKNYVVGSTAKSHSNVYEDNSTTRLPIPKKYRAVWNSLKYYYNQNFAQ